MLWAAAIAIALVGPGEFAVQNLLAKRTWATAEMAGQPATT